MHKSILWLVVVLAACGKEAPPPEEIRPVRVVTVGQEAAARVVELSGEVRARHEAALSFRVGGKLLERRVEVGRVVKAGEVLARLDAQDVGLNVEAMQAQEAAARVDLAQQQKDLLRAKELLAQKFVSQSEVDRRQAGVEAAQRKQEQVAAQLQLARNQSGYAVLRADAAGVVLGVDAEAGQVVAAGQSIVRVAKAGEREVVVDVAEQRRGELAMGQRVEVQFWAMPGQVWAGKVREIAPAADALTRTYRTKIQLFETDETVRLGMSASVRLVAGVPRGKGVSLPLSALFGEGLAQKVWILNASTGRVAARAVTVLDTTGSALRVEGLQAGEIVVTAGAHLLREGQKVRLMTAAEAR